MVHNHRVVALLVVLPDLLRNHFVGAPARVRLLDVGLLADAVQVLVQAVQQERQQLLAVVLLVAAELRRARTPPSA